MGFINQLTTGGPQFVTRHLGMHLAIRYKELMGDPTLHLLRLTASLTCRPGGDPWERKMKAENTTPQKI